MKERIGTIIAVASILVLWQILGETGAIHGTIASPTAILSSIGSDGWDYFGPNITTTLSEAGWGWLFGNAAAILLGALIVLMPRLEKLITQVSIAAYCIPLLAIGPLLQIVFGIDSPQTPKVILSALTCFFTTMVSLVVGLKSADRSSLDLIRAYGGGRFTQLTKVRMKSCLPSLFAGLRIAAPLALLGAIIGEYLGGDRGLGVAMITSQQGLHIERTWSLGVVSTLIAGAGYALTAVIGQRLVPWTPKASRS